MPLWYLEGHTAFSLLLRALWEEFGIFKSIPHSTGEAGQNEKKKSVYDRLRCSSASDRQHKTKIRQNLAFDL